MVEISRINHESEQQPLQAEQISPTPQIPVIQGRRHFLQGALAGMGALAIGNSAAEAAPAPSPTGSVNLPSLREYNIVPYQGLHERFATELNAGSPPPGHELAFLQELPMLYYEHENDFLDKNEKLIPTASLVLETAKLLWLISAVRIGDFKQRQIELRHLEIQIVMKKIKKD